MGRLLHYLSLACCTLVIVAFALFAQHQISHASRQQASAVAPTQGAGVGVPTQQPSVIASTRPNPAPRPSHQTGQPKRFIDNLAGKLTSPFTGVVSSDDAWVQHGIPTLIALLVYGGGLGYLARWSSARAR
jgi:hypothetical protein